MNKPCTCGKQRTYYNSYISTTVEGYISLSQLCKKCTSIQKSKQRWGKKSSEELRALRSKYTEYSIRISEELKLRSNSI